MKMGNMVMLKIKNILSLFLLFFAGSFSYAEYKNNAWPHVEFKSKEGTCYRIEGDLPAFTFFKNKDYGIQFYPQNNKGVFITKGYTGKYVDEESSKSFAAISIIPTIIFKNDYTRKLLEKKGTDIFWEDYEEYASNCSVLSLTVYENGISMNVDDYKSKSRTTYVYLQLKNDGRYYEVDSDEDLGKIEESYNNFEDIPYDQYYSFVLDYMYEGFVFYSVNKENKTVDRIILQGIKYFNKTENGIEFITPYGSGFYSFETEQINLVDKSNYVGKTFNYFKWNHIGWWYHGKISKKIITQDDFNFVPGGF